LIGKVSKKQILTSKNGKDYIMLTIDGQNMTTFYNVEDIDKRIHENDDVEYKTSKKNGFTNLISIKKVMGNTSDKLEKKFKRKSKSNNVETMIESFSDAIIIFDELDKKYKNTKYKDIFTFYSLGELNRVAIALFNKGEIK